MTLEIAFFVVPLILGYLFGRLAEKRHLKSIIGRERILNCLPAIASRYPPDDALYDQVLVSGSVVIASDYFKSFVAGLIGVFGGRVTPFESMLDRARREALLRMKVSAERHKARITCSTSSTTPRASPPAGSGRWRCWSTVPP